MRLYKIIQTVTYADSLHLLMRADIATGNLINIPLFHFDNLSQLLQVPTAVPLLASLFDLRQFIPALQPGGLICLTGLKVFCSVSVVILKTARTNAPARLAVAADTGIWITGSVIGERIFSSTESSAHNIAELLDVHTQVIVLSTFSDR